VLIIAGPTVSGKSRLAMDIAAAFAGTIVNADSMQVYRELRVLTARPSTADEARVPHRLYGVLAARTPCSAGHWAGLAAAEIEAALSARRLPIVVGGTGLYLKALVEGLAPIPAVPAEVRAAALSLHADLGGAAFREALAAVDPITAARLPPGDTQRLVRAWEVAAVTGRPLSDWQREAPQRPVAGVRFATLVLDPPREALNRAIDARLDAMIAEGAIAEVQGLLDLGLDPALPAMKAVGVKELAAYVRGRCVLESAAAAAKGATRRFAKRQQTWLRHRIAADMVVSEQYSERIGVKIFTFIRQFLLTPRS
jgi:tRNA dimethylallyltransferase